MIKTMNNVFLDSITDRKDLLKIEALNINKFLLENNLKQIEDIQKFLMSNTPLLLVNGFLGTGKSTVVNFATTLLKEDVIVLKYNCFETTILDDILLSFFEEFKNLTASGHLLPLKTKADNFVEKIEEYCSVLDKPILIIINSFEEVLKDNRQEILDFIFHISKNKSTIKTIFISRVFDYTSFEGNIEYARTTVLALEKSIFEKMLRANGVKLIGPVSDELYKYSRGYFFYTLLSLKVIKAHNLGLIDFLKGYTKSFLSYNDFILREALSFIDPVSGHLFRFLTIMRHPVSIKLLKTLNLYNEERINFFIENLILSKEKEMIYLQDYYKEISANSIPQSVAIKLHKSCVDLYNTQLPLKPFERDLLISRQTMRSEIEYHSMFIPKPAPIIKPLASTTLEAVEYSAEGVDEAEIAEDEKKEETKDEKIKHISFIFDSEEDEKKIMSDIANSINKFLDYSDKTLNEQETKLSLREMLNAAREAEAKYNYKKSIAFYQRTLLLKNDDDFTTFLPHIYTRLAKNYSAVKDWFNALRYYDLALEFYTTAGDLQKTAMMKLHIANIFYITFKHDKAKVLLSDILKNKGLNNEILIRANLLMANLCRENSLEVYSHCKKALELVDVNTDKTLLADLYFKHAVACDELNETETSVQYYKKCIDINKNNPHLAAAYANLADIFDEADYSTLASKYYLKSLEVDTENKNLSGMYTSTMKLAALNCRKAPEEAKDFYQKAISYANALKEPFYQLSSMIEYGDFCVLRKDFKAGLKNYKSALSLAKTDTSTDNVTRIEKRINDIKVRLGNEFDKIEQEIINEK